MELTKEFRFEASHRLPKHPGKCSRLHGHSWVLKVSVQGEIDPETHFVFDYAGISAVMKPIIEQLDHRHLGTWDGIENSPIIFNWAVVFLPDDFYPSSEELCIAIAGQIDDLLPWSKIELNETCTSACTLTKEDYEGRRQE